MNVHVRRKSLNPKVIFNVKRSPIPAPNSKVGQSSPESKLSTGPPHLSTAYPQVTHREFKRVHPQIHKSYYDDLLFHKPEKRNFWVVRDGEGRRVHPWGIRDGK